MKILDVLSGKKKKVSFKSMKLGNASAFSLGKVNLNWRMKGLQSDFDGDGVPDWRDCMPFDRSRQHRDPNDWMETTSEIPAVAHTGHEWMRKKKYKRTFPKESDYVRRNWTIRKKILFNAISRYFSGSNTSASNVANKIADDSYYKLYSGEYKRLPFAKDVVVIYDSTKKVFHYFEYDPDDNYSRLLFSVTSADRKKLGDVKIVKMMGR